MFRCFVGEQSASVFQEFPKDLFKTLLPILYVAFHEMTKQKNTGDANFHFIHC